MYFEAGVMIHSEILAGTAIKASGTDAQPDAAGSVLWGLGAHEVRWTTVLRGPERSGDFPNKQKIAFVTRKPCLQKKENTKNETKKLSNKRIISLRLPWKVV